MARLDKRDLRFPGRPEMLGTIAASTTIDTKALLEAMKKTIFKNRIRLRDFFIDHDPLRSGYVTEAKFRTALDEAGLDLNDPQLEQLAKYFADVSDPRRVCFEAMLDEIDSIFTTAGMESDPYSTVSDFTPTLSQTLPKLNLDEDDACDALIERLAAHVKHRQVEVRSVFDDYCKNINSTVVIDNVTKVQFRNGLSMLGLPVSLGETDLLYKRFAGKYQGYVNYIAFCCAIDPALKTFSEREPRSYIEKPLASSGFRYPIYHPAGVPDQPGRPPVSFNQPKLPVAYPANPELTKLLGKLQQKAVQHHLRLADFFIEFDKHCDGTVTQPVFVKRLSIAYDKIGIGLSEGEVELLIETYGKKMSHGAKHVEWRKFVADIDKVFTTVGMEKDPTLTPMYMTANQDPKTLSTPAKEAAVQKLLSDLKMRVDVRRVLVKPLFSDYGGWSHSIKISDHITRQNMVQSLSRFGIEISQADADLLFERYDTLGNGTVNFIAFVRDIDRYESFSGRTQSRHTFPQDPDYGSKPTMNSGFWKDRVVAGPIVNLQPGRPPTTNNQPSLVLPSEFAPPLQLLLEKLQRCAVTHRLRVSENFKDFDRHCDGTITVPQFQAACAMTFGKHLPLSQPEAELLCTTFAVPKSGTQHVNWKAFVTEVDKIFVEKGLEKTPYGTAPPLVANLPRPKAPLTAAEEAQVAAILARFRTYCSHRRVLVKPFFSDAEYNRRSMRVVDHITKSQFGQVLSRLSLEASNEEIALLCKKYDDKGDGFVNYVDFAVAIDEEEKGSDRDSAARPEVALFKANGNFKATKTNQWQPGRAPLVPNVPSLQSHRETASFPALMRRIQEKVIQFKVPLHDYFVDYDKANMGCISQPHFRRGLNLAFGPSYTLESPKADELDLLCSVYEREVLDGAQFVSWKEFVKDVNAAQFTPYLETTPLITPSPLVPMLGHVLPTLSEEKEAKVAKLLAQMKQRFAIRCVYVKAPFHDFAKSNNSPLMVDHVTRQQFTQGLSRLGIEPTADELELLFEKYNDSADGSVNYVAFATDVDPTETFSARERTAAFSMEPVSTFYGGFREPKVHEGLLRSM